MPELTQARLKELLHYDPDTGIFTWKLGMGNRVRPGDIAGTDGSAEYIGITIKRRIYMAHRLAFLYMNGSFPEQETDHLNHIKTDNRWENLRECTPSENQRNQSRQRRNISGITGVRWKRQERKWVAHISINKVSIHLGVYSKIEDAIEARLAANVKYGFHANHGR